MKFQKKKMFYIISYEYKYVTIVVYLSFQQVNNESRLKPDTIPIHTYNFKNNGFETIVYKKNRLFFSFCCNYLFNIFPFVISQCRIPSTIELLLIGKKQLWIIQADL